MPRPDVVAAPARAGHREGPRRPPPTREPTLQTFLPYPSFARSAAALDDRRLGKQRVETLQVLRALHLQDYGWRNHPAVAMWRGHSAALVAYGVAIVDEWRSRGFADGTRPDIVEFVHPDPPRHQDALAAVGQLPAWLGDPALHRSHRAALLRKDRERYGAWADEVDPQLPYVWPVPPDRPEHGRRRSAWVVRGDVDGNTVRLRAAVDESPWTPLDARGGRIVKRLRSVSRLVEGASTGDVLAVPVDGGTRLAVGVVGGPHRVDDGDHLRPVDWRGETLRRTLRFPAALQDPQPVFELFDEPTVERAARRAA